MPIQINICPDMEYTRQELDLIFRGGDSNNRAVYKMDTLRRYGLRAHGIYYHGQNVIDAISNLRKNINARGSAPAGKEKTRERKQQTFFDNQQTQDERIHTVRDEKGMGSLLERFERKVFQMQTSSK